MAGNTVVLEFAGDATKLAREQKKANDALDKYGQQVKNTTEEISKSSKASDDYLDRVSKLGNAVSGASDAIDSAGAATQAFADLQSSGANKIQRHERALNEVRQAQEDYNQALRDGEQSALDTYQAEIDMTQANLDQEIALKEYNKTVKEKGKNSDEARQAQIDLTQAGQDFLQAEEDNAQATRDAAQATIDAKSAQLDLNDAQKEANPPDVQKWADQINAFTPILSGLIGVMGLVTAAQWAWNAAQLASPTTWIILAIAALIAIIILIATKTDWFQRAWRASWGWIKDAASNTWNFIKKIPGWIGDAFRNVAGAITYPFRSAFNFIADAWNHTVGSLSWTVPGWIPKIGGNTINVPDIPKFHSGIDSVPGAPGSEMLAVLQAGERVTPAGSHGEALNITVMLDGEVLVQSINNVVNRSGGDVQLVIAGSR